MLHYAQWSIFGKPASQVMKVKLKYLCLTHRKRSDQAHLWMAAGRKTWTHTLRSPAGTRKLPPPPFSIKSLHPNSETMVLWDSGPPFSWSAGFPNKVTIPCPSNLSLDLLVCRGASSSNLDLIIGSHLRNQVIKNMEELPVLHIGSQAESGRLTENVCVFCLSQWKIKGKSLCLGSPHQ